MKKFKSGATSNSDSPDYTLCPKELVEAAINRFEEGLKRGHARNNWKLGKNDPEFVRARLNHAQKHFDKVLDGTGNRGDFEAVICNLAMISWWLKNGNGAKEVLAHLYE